MSALPQDYLETEILTAPPQKLRLRLIEAAIRNCQRARLHWEAGEDEAASNALARARQIVTELITGLNGQASPELVKKTAAIYVFLFRGLTEANLGRNREKVDDIIRVLEIERETWRQVCDCMTSQSDRENEAAVVTTSPPTASVVAPRFNLGAAETARLSLDA